MQIHPSQEMQNKDGLSINLLNQVPLELTVELGRTNKTIKEILSFTPGVVVELDKMAGEPLNFLVNGKIVGKAEVVTIDDKFGIRILEIAHNQL